MAQKTHKEYPSWLRWAVLAFVGYAIFNHYTGDGADRRTADEHARTVSEGVSIQPDATSGSDLSPHQSGKNEIAGSGEAAFCGQLATVGVQILHPAGALLPTPPALQDLHIPVGLSLGSNHATSAIARYVQGMRLGGVREITLPTHSVYDTAAGSATPADIPADITADTPLTLRLTLQALTPDLHAKADTLPLRVSRVRNGNGLIAHCGDKVTLRLSIWAADGTLQYQTPKDTPLEAWLGDPRLPYGLHHAMIGQQVGEVRQLLMPTAYQQRPQDHMKAEATDATHTPLPPALQALLTTSPTWMLLDVELLGRTKYE